MSAIFATVQLWLGFFLLTGVVPLIKSSNSFEAFALWAAITAIGATLILTWF